MLKILNILLSLILATAPALAQSVQLAPGQVLGNFGTTTAPARPTPLQSQLPSVTIESVGGGCSSAVADNTAALLAAVASVTGPVRVLFPENCTYNFTQTNAINFSKGGVYLEGSGQFGAALQYTPTGDGTFIKWSNGVNEMFWGGISNLSVLSSNTTFAKTMIEWFDVSTFTVDEVFCGGGVRGGVAKLQGGANKSVCIYSHGRDDTVVSRFQANAEIPIRIGLNPHYYLSADHYRFTNLYLVGDLGSGSNPLIKVDPGVVFTSTTFDGTQAWVGGAHGFDQNDTAATHWVSSVTAAGSGYTAGTPVTLTGGTCSTAITVLPLTVNGGGGITSAAIANPGVCSVTPSNPVSAASGGAAFNLTLVAGFRLAFNNVRSEQGVSGSAYTFNVRTNGQMQGLVISNSAMDTVRCGAYLKNTLFATIRDTTYQSGGCNQAVSARAADGNESLRYINDYWLTSVTHDVTGMTKIEGTDSPTGTSVTVPPTALYSQSVVGSNFNNLTVALDVAANTYNNVIITRPASTAQIIMGSGKALTVSNSIALISPDGSNLTFQGSNTYVARTTTDTLTNKTISGASNTLSNIGNASLTNPSTTVNGQTCTLGASCTVTAAASAVTIGTTTVGGGTTTRVLFDNAGVLGEYTISGTGNVAMTTNPVFTTPNLGTPSAVVLTNATGTAAGLTAGTVTTNANLTGAVTSVGNATLLGSFTSANLLGALTDETGTGAAVFANTPTLVAPAIGAATGTSLVLSGNLNNQGSAGSFGSGGTGNTVTSITLNGGSGASSGGALVALQKNTVSTWSVGNTSGVIGGAQNDFGIYNWNTSAFGFTLTSANSTATFAGPVVASSTLSATTSISSPIHACPGACTIQSNGSTFAGSISTGQLWFLGPTSLTPAAGTQLTVSQNTGGTPGTSTLGNLVGQFIAADTAIGTVAMDCFGNQCFFAARQAGGTQASKTATAGGNPIFSFGAQGWDTSAYASGATADFVATASTWSASNHGMYMKIRTTVDGSNALTERLRVQQGLSIGDPIDPGVGGLRATGATVQFTALGNDTASVDATVCRIAASGLLVTGTGALGICLGTSGAQFKTAFAPMVGGVDDIARLNFQNYRYRKGFGDGGAQVQYGLTAQDVETVLPDLVRHDASGAAINFDSGALLFIGLRAIQQLKADNDNIEARLEKLENRR